MKSTDDWRGCLDRIVGNSELLADLAGMIPDDKCKTVRNQAARANARLWGVINKMDQRLFDLHQDTIEAIEHLAEIRGTSLKVEIDSLVSAGLVSMNADRAKLRRLINDAWKENE